MQPRDLFAIWAPTASVWSQWAKPVSFINTLVSTQMPKKFDPQVAHPLALDPQTAIVVNLPGELSVRMGLALARQGYRPVPLFNAANGPSALVPMDQISNLLAQSASYLQQLSIDPQAPPAFLIDSQRLKGTRAPLPTTFDNRWLVFPQDFPSAIFLRSRHIERIVVLQQSSTLLGDDLTQVLLRWQEGGLSLIAQDANDPIKASHLTLKQPSQFAQLRWWFRGFVLMSLGFRRNSAGGFGSRIPEASSGSGYG